MKQTAVKLVRRVVSKRAISRLEDTYRKNRARLLGMRYGHPAKHLRVIAVTGTNGKTTTVNYL
ncbi:MAG: hypothetical protein WAQ26_01670, partial [Candidatus Saccharimonas aalborgensis]